MRTLAAAYAAPNDHEYHTHFDCPTGERIVVREPQLKGAAAKSGRTKCPVCTHLDGGPELPPRTFGDSHRR